MVAGKGALMTQYPPPFDPLPYATPPMPLQPRRPTSVTVIAIIAIIWGSIAVLAMMCAVPQYLGMQFTPNPVMDGIRKDPVLLGFHIASMVIGLALGIILLAGGIISLSLKPMGRTLLIVYAWGSIVTSIPSMILTVAVITPRTFQHVPNMAANPQMAQIMKLSAYGGVALSVVALTWPVLILYFMSRPRVKTAFEEGM
jgi:hypothetical protein